MIKTGVRRLLTAGAATVAVMVFSAGPASAHFCYFTEPNVRAELAGLDPKASSHLGIWQRRSPSSARLASRSADAAGVTTGTIIHAHAVMAGGTLKKGTAASPKPISHRTSMRSMRRSRTRWLPVRRDEAS